MSSFLNKIPLLTLFLSRIVPYFTVLLSCIPIFFGNIKFGRPAIFIDLIIKNFLLNSNVQNFSTYLFSPLLLSTLFEFWSSYKVRRTSFEEDFSSNICH